MRTSSWGKFSWQTMFYAAAGYDLNESSKRVKDPLYYNYFKSIGDVLPCKYCRDSYKVFFQSLNIQKYMNMPSCGLIRFVYDLKNLVSDKLKTQEEKALHEEYEKLIQSKSPNDPEFWKIMREKSHKICYTAPPPPFEEVVSELMKNRASCSAKMKTCRDPLTLYPATPDITSLRLQDSGKRDAELYNGGRKRTKKRTGNAIKSKTRKSLAKRPNVRSRKSARMTKRSKRK